MYPDAYEVGLPNQGVMILYEVLNERQGVLAERTYSVWPDLEALMREHQVPQFTVDSHRPVKAFDVFGLSFSTELGYTNMLTALDPGGREEVLFRLAKTGGVYVPGFYDVEYLPDGRIGRVVPNRSGVPWRVSKHTVMDLDEWPYPKQPLVPLAETVHERMSV
ncbi:TIGR03960 family B12-binding radical SAM protein, partial [Streptomyces sp. DT225]